jgi:hypothetical protein
MNVHSQNGLLQVSSIQQQNKSEEEQPIEDEKCLNYK